MLLHLSVGAYSLNTARAPRRRVRMTAHAPSPVSSLLPPPSVITRHERSDASWLRNMSGALTRQVVRSDATARRGLFAAACFEHTTFDAAKPIVEGASYLDAFGDWLFGRGAHSGFFMDDCCSGAAVQFNPTC